MAGGEPPDRAGMVGFVPELEDTRERVAARVSSLAVDADGPDVGEFGRRYYAGVGDEDLASRPVDVLAEHALAHWRLAHWRTQGTAIRTATTPDPRQPV